MSAVIAEQPLKVWLVEDDASIRWVLERALRNDGMQLRAFEAAEPALAALRIDTPDVLMTDIRMPGASGLELLKEVRAAQPTLPVIVMTAHSDLPSAVSAYEGGAFEYLPKPFDIDQAVELVRRAGQTARRTEGGDPELASIPELLGKAPAMQQVFRAIGRLSRSSVAVLITGESGTGKELVARALHQHSPRAAKPFVALNSAAIPSELLESELFGHEKGSFTGAEGQRRGRFEQANGGTLFLDEIGDMPTALQTRLLRVLAEGEFYRVGGQTPIRVDVRVVAATHQNLEDRVERGQFREDLYHRLNVIRIELPPLRSRTEDVSDLLRHYLAQAALELGTETKTLAQATLQALTNYRWPGNVRELVNLCRRVTALAPGAQIQLGDLPSEIQAIPAAVGADWVTALQQWAQSQPADAKPWLDQATPEFERVLILAALKRTRGHRQEAARVLGWGRNTLTRKSKELGINDDSSADGDADS
jgi:two-component system, NtrC family, nitrogen regulation response regulator GlnG